MQGVAPGALARSYRHTHCPAPCAAGDVQRPSTVPPLWETRREAARQIPSQMFMASKHQLAFTSPTSQIFTGTSTPAKPKRQPEKKLLWLSSAMACPCRRAKHGIVCPRQPGGLTYLRLLDDPPICGISNAVREHNTLHSLHKQKQYIKHSTKSTFAGSPRSCQTPSVGAEPVLAAQKTRCRSTAPPRLLHAWFVIQFAAASV